MSHGRRSRRVYVGCSQQATENTSRQASRLDSDGGDGDGGSSTADASNGADGTYDAGNTAADASPDGDAATYTWTPTGDEETTVEDAPPSGYPDSDGGFYPGYPQAPEDPNDESVLAQSIPALVGTTQTCVQSLAVPVLAGNSFVPVASCDSAGTMTCRWASACVLFYESPNGCAGNCSSNSTVKIVTQRRTLVSNAPAWLAPSACAAELVAGLGPAACSLNFGPPRCNVPWVWPVPAPTTVCK